MCSSGLVKMVFLSDCYAVRLGLFSPFFGMYYLPGKRTMKIAVRFL
jgi:hypothetical protein